MTEVMHQLHLPSREIESQSLFNIDSILHQKTNTEVDALTMTCLFDTIVWAILKHPNMKNLATKNFPKPSQRVKSMPESQLTKCNSKFIENNENKYHHLREEINKNLMFIDNFHNKQITMSDKTSLKNGLCDVSS